jgi:hypothetical protein
MGRRYGHPPRTQQTPPPSGGPWVTQLSLAQSALVEQGLPFDRPQPPKKTRSDTTLNRTRLFLMLDSLREAGRANRLYRTSHSAMPGEVSRSPEWVRIDLPAPHRYEAVTRLLNDALDLSSTWTRCSGVPRHIGSSSLRRSWHRRYRGKAKKKAGG